MERYELSKRDIKNNYFHFTRVKNLESIEEKGLLPKISIHAQALEETKKVFFVEGLDNLIILFDCWIHVCTKYPLFPGLFNLGTIVMRYKWFPKSIINGYFRYTEINKIHKWVAYKYFDHFLKTHIILNLDLKEGEDFSYDDIDQIKNKGYDKDYLVKGGYSLKYSDLDSNRMDKWNLHTYTDHIINNTKIKEVLLNGENDLTKILLFVINNTKMDVSDMCPDLFDYLQNRRLVKEIMI